MHRNTKRLTPDVPQRQLNASYSLRRNTSRRLSRHPIHVPIARLNRTRILTQQYRLEILYRPNNPIRVATIRHLAITRDTRIRPNRAELPWPPSRIYHKSLYIRYLHLIILPFNWRMRQRAHNLPISIVRYLIRHMSTLPRRANPKHRRRDAVSLHQTLANRSPVAAMCSTTASLRRTSARVD